MSRADSPKLGYAMIHMKILNLRECRYNAKNLEGVLPVLELVLLGVGTVGLCVDRRPCKKRVKPLFHPCPHLASDVSLMPMTDGVLQKVEHVEAPRAICEGMHRVCEIP